MSFNFRQDPEFILILAGGTLLVVVILVLYRVFLNARRQGKAERLSAELTGGVRRPRELATPDDLARVSELTAKFEEGVKTFRNLGKNLYSLPWYVLVGEPGSGKTEALRHCGVPSPAALGELPGVGGTINMNWWFTNHGVVLDTAGRIMFEGVEAGKTSEWKRFLELLARSRPNCAINGLLLVIPADSLILDNASQVDRKARRIAGQFDLIQRTLGIRFPVFVVITKSDLINGFRSFFDTLNDPQLANQMLGWSNPDKDLDAPFRPEQVDRHLESVRDRLLSRRMALLLDPVNAVDPAARRADQVDDLYSFPDSLVSIAPRLRQYMEMIFVRGEWSPKPLFVRGIYFTSSMREGPALDKELADALGVPVNSLPEGRVWDQERAFFLRDLFMKKVFPEKGLVTREKKATGLHRRRKVAVLAAGFGAVFLLLGLTWYGSRQLDSHVLSHRDWWARLRALSESGAAGPALIQPAGPGNDPRPAYKYAGADPAFGQTPQYKGDPTTLRQLHDDALKEVDAPIEVPPVFRPVAAFQGNLVARERREAYRAVYLRTVLAPLVDAVRNRMAAQTAARENEPKGENEPKWDEDATDALTQLIRLEAASAGPPAPATGGAAADAGQPAAPRILLEPLFRYALGGPRSDQYLAYQNDQAPLQNTLDALYAPDGVWPPPSLLGNDGSRQVIAAGVEAFVQWCQRNTADPANRPGRLTNLRKGLVALEVAENQTSKVLLQDNPDGPKNAEDYKRLFQAWRTGLDNMTAAAVALGPLLKEADLHPGDSLPALYRKELSADLDRDKRGYDALLKAIPTFPDRPAPATGPSPVAPPAPAPAEDPARQASIDALNKARNRLLEGSVQLPDLDAAVAPIAADLKRLQEAYLGPAADDPAQQRYQAFGRAYQSAQQRLADPDAGPRPSGPDAACLPPAGEGLLDQWSKLPARLSTVTRNAATTVGQIDINAPRGSPHADTVQKLCGYVVWRLGAPYWRYLALTAVIDGEQVPRTKEAVGAAVAALARTSRDSMDEPPVLPFAGFRKGEAYKAEFHRGEAFNLIGAWAALAPRLQASAGGPAPATSPAGGDEQILDAAGLQKTYGGRTAAAFDPYVAAYVDYWVGLLDRVRPGQAGVRVADWKSFKDGLPPNATSVNDGLGRLVTTVFNALEKMGPALPAPLAARAEKTVKDLRAAGEALSPPKNNLVVNQRLLDASAQAVKSWRGLPVDPAQAAVAAFRARAAQFAAGYFVFPADRNTNVAYDYWAAVTTQGFDALCKANTGPQPDLARATRQKFERFPLAPPGAGPELATVADLGRALKEIKAVLEMAPLLGDEPTLDEEKNLDRGFWTRFRRLGPAKPADADIQWLNQATRLLAVLPADGAARSCTVRTLPLPKQIADTKLPGFGSVKVGEKYLNQVRLGGQGLFDETFPAPGAVPAVLGQPEIGEKPALSVVFKPSPDAAPLPAAVTFDGPWAPIRMLYSPHAVRVDGAGKVWHVEVVQPNFPKPGNQSSAWLEVEFAEPIPIAR